MRHTPLKGAETKDVGRKQKNNSMDRSIDGSIDRIDRIDSYMERKKEENKERNRSIEKKKETTDHSIDPTNKGKEGEVIIIQLESMSPSG